MGHLCSAGISFAVDCPIAGAEEEALNLPSWWWKMALFEAGLDHP
jgi:hypothetical protein